MAAASRFCVGLAAVLVAAVVASAAGASHLHVQFVVFETQLVPTLGSKSDKVWQELAVHLARDPNAVAQAQFDALSITSTREIRVSWTLACFPDGPPDVDHISYNLTAELRQFPGDERMPPGVRESIIATDQTGSGTLTVPAGIVADARATAHCGGLGVGPSSGGIHGSKTIEQRGQAIAVPPFVPLPVFLVPTAGRALSATAAKYKLLRGSTLPVRKVVYVVPGLGVHLEADQSATVTLRGAGVNVVRRVTADDVANGRHLVVAVRPKRRGTIRYWAKLEPYGAQSSTIALRVR